MWAANASMMHDMAVQATIHSAQHLAIDSRSHVTGQAKFQENQTKNTALRYSGEGYFLTKN